MKKYELEKINKMKKYVINSLVADYQYDSKLAEKTVENSVFRKLLEEDTDYVFHYSVDYWAKEINNEIH